MSHLINKTAHTPKNQHIHTATPTALLIHLKKTVFSHNNIPKSRKNLLPLHPQTKTAGYPYPNLVRWMSGLVSGLQNQQGRFDSATHLKKDIGSPMSFFVFKCKVQKCKNAKVQRCKSIAPNHSVGQYGLAYVERADFQRVCWRHGFGSVVFKCHAQGYACKEK